MESLVARYRLRTGERYVLVEMSYQLLYFVEEGSINEKLANPFARSTVLEVLTKLKNYCVAGRAVVGPAQVRN